MIMIAKSLKYLVLFITVLGLALTLTACGKKAMPKPPRYVEPPAIIDLTIANVENDVITLTWSLPPSDDEYNLKTVHVYLAQDALATLCLTCPPNFVLIGDGKSITNDDGTRVYTYQMRIQPGFRYVYKVNAAGRENQEGADSNYAVYNHE